jgi:hypothetical protein
MSALSMAGCSLIDGLRGEGSGDSFACDEVFVGEVDSITQIDEVFDTCAVGDTDGQVTPPGCGLSNGERVAFGIEVRDPGSYEICATESGEATAAGQFSIARDCFDDTSGPATCEIGSCITRTLDGGRHFILWDANGCRPGIQVSVRAATAACSQPAEVCSLCADIDPSCFGGQPACEAKFGCLRGGPAGCGLEFGNMANCFRSSGGAPCFPPQGPCGAEVNAYLACRGDPQAADECGICPDAC